MSICTSSFDADTAAAAEAVAEDDVDFGLIEAVTVTSGCCAAAAATSAAAAAALVDDDFLIALPGPLPTTGDPA